MQLVEQIMAITATVESFFDSAQRSSATSHRKLASQLYALLVKNAEADSTRLLDCLKCILAGKKKEPCADKSIKFVRCFIDLLREKIEAFESAGVEQECLTEMLRLFLRGSSASEKLVRVKSCQLLTQCINCMAEME